MQPNRHDNRPWEIAGAAEPTLRIGRQELSLREICGISPSAHQERDFHASLLNYSAYLIVAAIFLVLVVQAGWRERFLLVTVFFAAIGFTSLVDIGRASRIRLYRLTITKSDGSQVQFTSADPAEVDRLADALRRAGVASIAARPAGCG